MKTVCKKLLCLMLVAMMLVSAVPFASATLITPIGPTTRPGGNESGETVVFWIELHVDGTHLDSQSVNAVKGKALSENDVKNLAKAKWPEYFEDYDFVSADPQSAEAMQSDNRGSEVHLETPAGGGNSGNQGGSNTEQKITFTVNVGDWSKDERVATNVNSFQMTEDEMEELLDGDKVDVAKYLLAGTAYAADAKAGNVYSVIRYTGSKEVNVWLNSVSGGSQGGNSGNQGGNTGNQGGVIGNKVKLTIVYGYTGNRTETVTFGTKYLSVVGEPARPGYNFMGWYSDNLDDFVGRNDKITDDDTITAIWEGPLKYSLTFDVNRKGVEPINTLKQVTYGEAIGKLPTPKADDFVFLGWKLNGKMINENTVYELQGDATAYAVWALESDIPGLPSWGGIINNAKHSKVYLEIYTNGDTGDLVRRVDITDYADDFKITRAEAEKVAKKYVTAKSGYSLKYEGLFDEEGWWWYCRDRETDGEDYIRVNREGDEYIYIMVKNVKKAVADSSNPKTGDNIMIAVGTMALSAAALVSIVELKKRKMI